MGAGLSEQSFPCLFVKDAFNPIIIFVEFEISAKHVIIGYSFDCHRPFKWYEKSILI
jgi:hypothetical protein